MIRFCLFIAIVISSHISKSQDDKSYDKMVLYSLYKYGGVNTVTPHSIKDMMETVGVVVLDTAVINKVVEFREEIKSSMKRIYPEVIDIRFRISFIRQNETIDFIAFTEFDGVYIGYDEVYKDDSGKIDELINTYLKDYIHPKHGWYPVNN